MLQLQVITNPDQRLVVKQIPSSRVIHPDESASLHLPANLDLNREVILFGQIPIWLYARLIEMCRDAPWIGCFSPMELGAVVVSRRIPERAIGDVVSLQFDASPCPAILIGDPPNSGKSVLSNAIRRSLQQHCPEQQIFLYRANWDGEGNWTHDTGKRSLVNRLVRQHERRIHKRPDAKSLMDDFFETHAEAIANLRQVVDIVLVDVEGKPQPENDHPLELIADPWEAQQTKVIPDNLLHAILKDMNLSSPVSV